MVVMRLHARIRPARTGGALLLALACAAAVPAEPVPGPALELLPQGALVLHCGLTRGVLYVTYARDGRELTAPAFHTPAIRQACAAAGQPLAGGPRAQLAAPIAAPRIGAVPAPAPLAAVRAAAEPSFVVRVEAGGIRVDGRNDGDVALHCVLNLAWTADHEPGGSRAVTAQAMLPPRQSNPLLWIAAGQAHPRIVGLPRWNCRPGS